MIDTSEILTQADQYAFSLFDIDLIDFTAIEFDNYGTASLPLKTTKTPLITEPLENEDDIIINDAILDGDIWFTYDPIEQAVDMLVAESFAVQRRYSISATIYLMKQINHSEYDKYKEVYDMFNKAITDKLKEQIRSIMTDVKGKFVKDTIKRDTYFQSRKENQQNIYYIIYRWWDKLLDGEVNFTDIVNGDGTVYIARNN